MKIRNLLLWGVVLLLTISCNEIANEKQNIAENIAENIRVLTPSFDTCIVEFIKKATSHASAKKHSMQVQLSMYNDSMFYLKLYYSEPIFNKNLLGVKRYDDVDAYFYSPIKSIPFLKIDPVSFRRSQFQPADKGDLRSVFSEFYLYDGRSSFQIETLNGFIDNVW